MPRYSPLDAQHRAAGAKMVDFGGWEMPLAYQDGTIAEHLRCRRAVAMFDVSHLGTVRLDGPGAFDRLQEMLTNDLRRIGPGRAQYTHLLDDDASVLDDIIVWWREAEVFDVMPNASNTAPVVEALGGSDTTAERAIIAVQGPEARRAMSRVAPAAATVARFAVTPFVWEGHTCCAAGTGYTGEDGVECAVPVAAAADFWAAMVQAGATPAGLGARDTLRLEAGLPLHGNELGPGITPLQAGLGWVVGWDKPAFRGRDALLREKEAGPSRRLRGVRLEGRQPPRHGQTVLVDGRPSGLVTSGNFSPVLEVGIGLAFLPPDVPRDTAVEIDSRGRPLAGRVVPLPFVTPGAAR
ncbi:MAG TPA: glycine cleavage system aminomethyltransferase GcvT [Acidimicrobiales bacterium]|nr:glycine cleavage system aminomethyltransferase GcvT [Acidimicrobiales bacterium]